MRDRGKPTISIMVMPGTAEQVARNRELLRSVCEEICGGASRRVRLTMEWGALSGHTTDQHKNES